VAGASALVLVALTVAGCSGGSITQGELTGEVARAVAPADDVAGAAAACEAVSDVMTVAENVAVAVGEARMTAQEQQGWYQVASRMLDRIPVTGDAAVDQGVEGLRAAVPAVAAGARAEPFELTSDAWNEALASLDEPCLAADAELAVSVFTGG